MKRPKIGLALGGGGARGLAHIGVLNVFEQNNIPVDCIAGTSIGAIVGGAYALSLDLEWVEKRMRELVESEAYDKSGLDLFAKSEPAENFFGQVAKYVRQRVVINLAHSRNSLVSVRRLEQVIEFLLPDKNIEQSQLPLAIVATDLADGKDAVFTSGSIRKAALASASIPGFLPPVKYNGQLLTDGAVTSPVPVDAVFGLGADIVIAVDVSQDIEDIEQGLSIIDVIFRGSAITSRCLRDLQTQNANLVLRPKVGHVHWADFREFDALIEAGENAARDQIAELRQILKEANSIWRKMLRFSRTRPNGKQRVERKA